LAASVPHSAPRPRSITPYAIWTLQLALAALFLFAGAMKFVMPAEDLTKDTSLSVGFLRLIGACEVLGAIGLVISGLGGNWRALTPLAAAGLVIIMIGAVTVNTIELGAAAAVLPFAVGLLLALVTYARRAWVASLSTRTL